MSDKNHPLNAAYEDIKGSITAVCKGCAIVTKSLEAARGPGFACDWKSVSYTHLTLPTIYSV